MGFGIPDYKNLDLSGEARLAAQNMEDRAQEPASQRLFDALVAPLLSPGLRVLEFGCGTGALAARISAHAEVLATDKSEGMIEVARTLRPGIAFETWDVTDVQARLSSPEFDLIVSSVVTPYLTDSELGLAIDRLGQMLAKGGTLAFVEQDISSLEIASPFPDVVEKIVRRSSASVKNSHICLEMLPLLHETGLEAMPVESFTWTDPAYCPYVRRLLARTAKDLTAAGELTEEEANAWLGSLENLAAEGRFLYSLTYRRIAGRNR